MNNYPEYAEIGEKRYKINTDFRNAIECNRIAQDDTIGDFERALGIIYTLFGDEGLSDPENYGNLLKTAQYYLTCGKGLEDTMQEPDMDFIKDFDYISASFMSDYSMNIEDIEMHWWKFFNLVNGLSNSELGNCCVLNRIRNLRNFDVNEIKDEKERQKIIEAKDKVALNRKPHKEVKLTEEQQRSVDEFYENLKI